MAFKIVEGKTLDYETVKEAYLSGIYGVELREMFGMGTSQYSTMLKRFREDGIHVPKHGNIRPNNLPRNYHPRKSHGRTYWIVTKTINWKKYNFGSYKTEEEAKARVQELRESNWMGLLE